MRKKKMTERRMSAWRVTAETVCQVCSFERYPPEAQQRMVAPNAVSIAEGISSDKAWFRAIYAGEMLASSCSDDPDDIDYFCGG
jgi:hypothetical protein